jgi:hypothetical protein
MNLIRFDKSAIVISFQGQRPCLTTDKTRENDELRIGFIFTIAFMCGRNCDCVLSIDSRCVPCIAGGRFVRQCFFFFFFFFSSWLPTIHADKSSFNPNDYDHYVRFDSNVPASACVSGNEIDLYWTIFATHIELMAINVQHNGYVSVGWCEQGTYTPARKEVAPRCTYISGAVRVSNGQVACFDQYDKIPTPATGQHSTVTPRRDNLYGGTDHNLDCAGAIVGGSLKFKWTRLLDTRETATFSAQSVSHSMDTSIINGNQWMIWAVGPDTFDCINAFNAAANTAGSDCAGAVHPGCGWERFNWFTDHATGSPATPAVTTTTTTSTTTSTTATTTSTTRLLSTPNPTPRPTPLPPTPMPTRAPTPPPSPAVWSSAVAHWTFDNTYTDEIRGTALTPRNNPTFSTRFAVGNGALSLTNAVESVALDSAQNAVVDVSNDRFNLTDASNQMSHSLWFRCLSGRCSGILVWTQNGYLRLFEVANGNTTMRFALYANGVSNELNSGEVVAKDGEFHHFAAVFDGATMKIFYDCSTPTCSPVASVAFGPAVLNPGVSANTGNCGVLFGARCQRDTASTAGTNAFRGEIDDYMLFNSALSIDDILRIRGRKPTLAPTPLPTPATTTTTTARIITTTTHPSTSTTTSSTTTSSGGSLSTSNTVGTTSTTPSPTPPPTPAPTPVPLNAPCSAYSIACSQCVDSSMHSASTCRFCDNKCLDTADTATTCSSDAFYNIAPDDIAGCPRLAPPIRSQWHEVAASGNSTADFRLRWRHDESNIEFEVSAKTDGWVGVGWSRAKFSEGANHFTMETFVGSLSGAGVTRVANGYSMFDIVQPATNAKPLVLGLPTVSAVGGRTTLSFVRPITVPSDASQNVAIEDRIMYVSWAVGADDIERTPAGMQCRANSVAVDDVFCFKEHIAAGVLPVNFLNPTVESTTTTVVVAPTETSSASRAFIALATVLVQAITILHE